MSDTVARLNAALSGRYRVERQLGEGGMATVYLADDLRHGRDVALKVLRPELAAIVGAERFLAEIRTTARLQHPHILPLHDSGDADGLLYYVMPRVQGESLRDRLDRERQLPVEEAVRIATQVAEALDYAHRQGVIHRDIKPANLLLIDGQPVIADFGIALAVTTGGAGRLTETGLSLGTPHYMSPEQATGDQTVAPATDIWALGCVLYEMLAGEPPYTGGTPQAVLGRIITAASPSASEVRRSVPPNVDAAIRKALEKVPADRFGSAGAFARALSDSAFRHGPSVPTAATLRSRKGVTVGFAALAVVLAAGLLWSLGDTESGATPAVVRFDVTPPDDQRIPLVPGVDFALSPDGRRFVFVGVAPSGASHLFQRSVESLEAIPLEGTEHALSPTISPDGRSVAYALEGEIRIMPLEGGPSSALVAGSGPVWGPDGLIYFPLGDVIHRVSPSGGVPEAVTVPVPGRAQRFPWVLPEGRGLLVSLLGPAPTPADTRIGVVGPDGGEVREILRGAMARYSTTGHILYSTAEGELMAVAFDIRRLEVTGTPVVLLTDLVVKAGSATQLAISESGTLLYGVESGGLVELVWVSRSGAVQPVDSAWLADFNSPALSPDGTRLAVQIRTPESNEIWIKELDRGPSRRLTLESSHSDMPAWSPDGASVAYLSNQAGSSWDLYSKPADGSGQASLLLDEDTVLMEPLWSPSGDWLVYGRTAAGVANLFATRPRSREPAVPVAETDSREIAPTFSPDGRYIAYSSNESGYYEVYVVPFPDVGSAKWAVSTGGGAEPVWSREGSELFYRNLEGDMVSVPVSTSPTFSMGTPTALFPAAEYRFFINHQQYDVAPDGERFLMLRPLSGEIRRWVLALDYAEELRRLPR